MSQACTADLLLDRELLWQVVQGSLSLVCVSKGTAEGVLHLQVLGRQASIRVNSSGCHEGEEAMEGGVGCCLWLQMLSTICMHPFCALVLVKYEKKEPILLASPGLISSVCCTVNNDQTMKDRGPAGDGHGAEGGGGGR